MGKTVLVDYRTPKDVCERMEYEGLSLLFTSKHPKLSLPVDGHPDMMFHRVSDQMKILDPDFFEAFYKKNTDKVTPSEWKKVKVGESTLSEKYPGDIPYNILRIGKVAFGRTDMLDPRLKLALENEGIRLIKVGQGYGKCSVAVVDDTHGITSDKGLYHAMSKEGIKVLWVPPGGVLLSGYEYGFIGGASGSIGDSFFLTGRYAEDDINKRIQAFVADSGKRLCYLSEGQIFDIGSILEW